MKKRKRLYDVQIKHLNGVVDSVSDKETEGLASMVLSEFDRKETLIIGKMLVPYHAIDSVTVDAENTEVTVLDTTCIKGCNSMNDPVIEGDMSPITVATGVEFDPTEGITATDDNGESVKVTASVKGE